MRRRKFIILVGGLAVASPGAAWAQAQSDDQCKQASGDVKVIGFLNSSSPEAMPQSLDAFRQGLRDAGYVEGQNIIIDYRWGNDNNQVLPTKARQLAECKVKLIAATGGTPS